MPGLVYGVIVTDKLGLADSLRGIAVTGQFTRGGNRDMGQYLGLVQLGSALRSTINTRNNGTPKDPDAAPTYRVYGPAGVMAQGTGSLAWKEPSATGGAITGATNATPIVITSAGHLLTTGTRITIANVLGNLAANGDWNVTVIDPNTFSLQGSAGNGAYVSGGTWHTSGLWDVNFTPQGANGFVQGQNYSILVQYAYAGVQMSDIDTFTVV